MAANLTITFKHIPTNLTVNFTAFLETFTDSYDAEWSSEKVFGRMDPIAQYKGTGRKVGCTFTIPSESYEHALVNHAKISRLLQMMYPTYEGELNTYNIAAPPLMEVKFNNIIRDQSDNNRKRGLIGYVPSLKYEPDMNSAIFTFDSSNLPQTGLQQKLAKYGLNKKEAARLADSIKNDNEMIGWQSLKVNFELNVLHSHKLGFKVGDFKDTFARYPYGQSILG